MSHLMHAEVSAEIQSPDESGPTRPRVLIVDDLEDNRIILARRLTRRHFEVVEAAGGIEALERLDEQLFDLVLLDVMMPDLDGFETLNRIRAKHSAAELPVIMV